MGKSLKLFDEHFVGIDKTQVNVAPLAFMTPYEDNAAGEKRQNSVKEWLYGYSHRWNPDVVAQAQHKETKTVPNQAQAGFRVVDFASRFSTSNKLARIVDPNGFEVEISISNLIELMLSTTIDNGEIKGECIWVRDGANNVLMRADDERVAEAQNNMMSNGKPKRKRVDHEVGDIIENSYGQFLYLGYFDVNYVVAAGAVEDDVEFGKRHIYVNYYKDPRYMNLEYVLMRKKKMTAQKVVKRALELVPTVTPQTYFMCEETQYYDATGTLLGERSKHYYDYRRRIGRDVWETSVVRFDTSEPIDVERIPANLLGTRDDLYT